MGRALKKKRENWVHELERQRVLEKKPPDKKNIATRTTHSGC